ncbi:MAG: hypothetical protein IKO47_08705 [Ruminococcus sp.]|nr:hypothetical protein [Ruminococcus sp.]
MNDKIDQIAANYTFKQQRAVFVEECSEAIQAVCKLERATEETLYDYAEAITALTSEVADVLIMAQQMRLFLGADKVDKEINRKLERQLQRIKDKYNE